MTELRSGWASIRALRAYFRGAEYPMGRLEAWVEAYKMVRGGWPKAVRTNRTYSNLSEETN